MRVRKLLPVLLALFSGLGGLLVISPAVANGTTVTTLSFNICGVVCRHGEVRNTASYSTTKISGAHANVATLSEVCYSQYRRIKSLLAPQGYTAAYVSQTHSGSCDNYDRQHGTGFGIALFVKGSSWNRTVVPLPVPSGYEHRNLLGVTARIAGRTTFVAVIHTSPSAKAGLDAQLKTVTRYLNGKTVPVIAGGDFNALPAHPGLTGLYSPAAGGTGKFIEADECHWGCSHRSGAATFDVAGRKIDYIWASQKYFATPTATTTGTIMSDHRIYVGQVKIR